LQLGDREHIHSEAGRELNRIKLKRVRYAVVGLGHIAQVAVMPAFAHTKQCELAALISGDRTKRRKLSQTYRVPSFGYEEYEEALQREAVDAVYIALPNWQHREFTERAARVGVHVLCEKPMAPTEADCRAMIAACDKAGVHLMIAYRLHFAPSHVEAIELGRSGKLGELRFFSSIFGMQVRNNNIRTEDKEAGGPLFDLGVYCINAARYLFGDEPEEVTAFTGKPARDKRFDKVEEMTTALLRFTGDRIAQFTCSFNSADVAALELVGTKGLLRMQRAYEYVGEVTWTIEVGEKETKRKFPQMDQFAPELDHLAECILQGKTPEPDGYEGLADVAIINSIFKSARTGKAVRVPAVGPQQRVQKSQATRRPAVKKPKLVKAKAGSA